MTKTIGSCNDRRGYDVYVDNVEDAQIMVDLLCQEMNWQPVRVIFTGRKTRCVYGRYFVDKKRMILNVKGQQEGSIMHELAHYNCHNHPPAFRETQQKLINLWYG